MYTILKLFCLCFSVNYCFAQSNEGDNCKMEITNKPGKCISIDLCEEALKGIRAGKWPQTCGYKGTVPIVCCEVSNLVVEKNPDVVGMKSREKCREYAKYVNVTFEPPTLSGNSKPKSKVRNECGFKSVKLIVGGTKAGVKEFPHMAAVGYDDGAGGKRFLCGGSLISENFVLTAAHCLYSRENGVVKYVRVGDLDLKLDTDIADPQDYNVLEFFKHPEYKTSSKYNDIALLKLETDVEFNPYVRPACLNTVFNFDAQHAIASGWGLTNFSGSQSDHLLKVTLEFFQFEECKVIFKAEKKLADGIVNKTQICAGFKEERRDTCQGDSGGPLQIYNADNYCMYDLIGITSFGKACGVSAAPGIYTRISNYIDWIENIVWP